MAESLNYIMAQTIVKRAIRELKNDSDVTNIIMQKYSQKFG